jgi:hypothetical protein
VVGVAGGEFGIRGFISAYDAKTGAEAWRFYTIPGPGEPGHETWRGDDWKYGGASIWVTGSCDPELNLTYWGIGNPGPDWNPDQRPGDNLYSDSVVALDADTGKLKWHFQFTQPRTYLKSRGTNDVETRLLFFLYCRRPFLICETCLSFAVHLRRPRPAHPVFNSIEVRWSYGFSCQSALRRDRTNWKSERTRHPWRRPTEKPGSKTKLRRCASKSTRAISHQGTTSLL